MDKKVWSIITKMIVSVNRSIERTGRRPRYSDVLIMRMYLWAVWPDRPMFWACDRSNYDTLFRPRALPSVMDPATSTSAYAELTVLSAQVTPLALDELVPDSRRIPQAPVSVSPLAASRIHVSSPPGAFDSGGRSHVQSVSKYAQASE